MPDRNVKSEVKDRLFHLGGWGFSVLAVYWGVAILLQSNARMSAPGWTVAMNAPGGPLFWGGWMLLFGTLMVTAMLMRDKGTTLMQWSSLAVSFAVFGRCVASFLSLPDPTTSLTAPPAWFAFTCVYMAQGIVHARAFRD